MYLKFLDWKKITQLRNGTRVEVTKKIDRTLDMYVQYCGQRSYGWDPRQPERQSWAWWRPGWGWWRSGGWSVYGRKHEIWRDRKKSTSDLILKTARWSRVSDVVTRATTQEASCPGPGVNPCTSETHGLVLLKIKKALPSGMGRVFSLMVSSDSLWGRGPGGISGSSSSSPSPHTVTEIAENSVFRGWKQSSVVMVRRRPGESTTEYSSLSSSTLTSGGI